MLQIVWATRTSKNQFNNSKSLAAKYRRTGRIRARTRAQVLSLVADHAVDGTKKFEKLALRRGVAQYLHVRQRTAQTQIAMKPEVPGRDKGDR